MPYAKNMQIYTCPSAPSIMARTPSADHLFTGGYGCNRNVMGPNLGRALAEMADAAGTFIACDTAYAAYRRWSTTSSRRRGSSW